jgi:L-ribulokinase
MAGHHYTVGVDFGTLSGRAVLVRVSDGAEMGSAVHAYRDAVLEHALPSGAVLPPDWALQNPDDWIEVLKTAVPEALAAAAVDPADVIGIGTDFTACTVLPTTADGSPLCRSAQWRDRPHSWPKLWKHHAAQPQADRINDLAHSRREPWIARYGGRISSEWQFAKALQLLEDDPEVYAATQRWIEAADWIVWQLTGRETRNACTAGYKGIYQDGRYPSRDYLAALHPDFADFAASRLDTAPLAALGGAAGALTSQAARWTGLPEGIAVSVGNVDAHVSAPAAQATEAGQLLAVMGTSTCHVLSSAVLAEVPGMCGVVDGGIVAGRYGYEAGQSGVGDIFAWWIDSAVPARYHADAAARQVSVHQHLSDLTAHDPVGAHGLLALDWMGGNPPCSSITSCPGSSSA